MPETPAPAVDSPAAYLNRELSWLAAAGLPIFGGGELDEAQCGDRRDFFHQSAEPVLTPLAVDAAHPFPFISNLTLGRYLAQGRVYRFEDGGEPELFLGSADWRQRNLDRRVEALTPVKDPRVRAELEAESAPLAGGGACRTS